LYQTVEPSNQIKSLFVRTIATLQASRLCS